MKKALLAAGVVVFAAASGFFLLRAAGVTPRSAEPFDRPRWEAVVAQVNVLGMAPGQTMELRLDDLADPRSLHVRRPGEGTARGQGAGNVWAQKAPHGELKVVIETRDLGHAGEYGFAYSEAPLSPSPFGGEWLSLDVPGHLSLALPRMRIDEHWWEVVYNLD